MSVIYIKDTDYNPLLQPHSTKYFLNSYEINVVYITKILHYVENVFKKPLQYKILAGLSEASTATVGPIFKFLRNTPPFDV